MFPFINESTAKKINPIKEKFDKYFTIIISGLIVLSTLWDIICFHCYWSDYILELYSCFFLVFMGLYFIMPAKIPKIITNYLGIIKTTLGRSIIMIFFSLLFLGDAHLFHKIISILLFIGGILLLIMELTSPENFKSKNYYESNENNNNEKSQDIGNNDISQNDTNPPTKLDEDSQQPAPENLNNLNNFNDLNNPEINSSVNNNENDNIENNNNKGADIDNDNNDKNEQNISKEEN